MQSVGEARRFWWRRATPPATPPLNLALDPSDRAGVQLAASGPQTPSRIHGRRRGISLPLAMACGGLAVFTVASVGGTRILPPGSVLTELDRLAAEAGLAIRDITVSGHDRAREREVYAAIDGLSARSLIGFDTRAARIAVERLPWVASATVTRAWPDRIVVAVVARRPAAIWRSGARERLIDATGHVIAEVAPGAASGLPLLVGEGVPAAIMEIISLLVTRPELAAHVARAERIAGRRWTLVTHAGQRIHLPAGPMALIGNALDGLMAGRDGARLIDRAFGTLDLRSPDRVIVSAAFAAAAP